MESPDQILKKRRLDHVKEALEMIKSKVAYRVLTEENRDVIEAKPADWTREHQERLVSLAKATAEFNYHFRFGIVEDRWYPLTQLISINMGKTFLFPENTYEVHALTGRFRSLLKKGNSKNWGAGKGENIKVRCIDGGFKVVFQKTHLILAAVWPDKRVDNVDHVDGNRHNNSVLNLDNVTNSMNSTRMHLSAKGAKAAKKGGTSNSKKICLLNEDGDTIKVFESRKEAGKFAIKPKQKEEGGLGLHYKNWESAAVAIGKVANGKRETAQGSRWSYYCTEPTRTPDSAKAALEKHGIDVDLVDFPPLEIKNFEDLPLSRRRLIMNWVASNKKANPPKTVTNYGEVLTNYSRWTTGSLEHERTSLVAKTVCGKRVHAWVMLFFHESDDDVVKWMNGDVDWDILHMDGDKTNPATYHPYTHEDGDDAAPYTNAFFTLRFGTRSENNQDRFAKRKRSRKSSAALCRFRDMFLSRASIKS
tara:strand:- start:682 stop:2109 length:1428 start_codon:yes stop_codon:yes gene_type:complete